MPEIKHAINDGQRLNFSALILLQEMVNFQVTWPTYLEGDDKDLEDVLLWMYSKDLIEVRDDKYVPADKGSTTLKTYLTKFEEYLKVYDIFSLVDTEKGKFAFSKYYDKSEEEWEVYKAKDRWVDLRMAVAEFKKLDLIEIGFMLFFNEGKFDTQKTGWQFDIKSDEVWNELVEVVNNQITVKELVDGGGGEGVMATIIEEGAEVMLTLFKREEELAEEEAEEESEGNEEVIEETETTYYVETVEADYYDYDYYAYYRDPYYVSDIFMTALIIDAIID